MNKDHFYRFPIEYNILTDAKLHAKSEVEASLKQFVELIVLTTPGEFRFDTQFGCTIWEREYNLMSNGERWKKEFKNSVEIALKTYEHRLENIKVNILNISETSQLNKKIALLIEGIIRQTGKTFTHSFAIIMCPQGIER